MQKSLYQDEAFAAYWNDRAGDSGEVYKRYVLDPIMFDLVGDFKGKVVLDLGCGNGYLGSKLLEQSPKQVVMADISKHNLRHAAEKYNDDRIRFLQQDVTEQWEVDTASVDIIYSNMLFNEIEDIRTPIKEAFRTLKNNDGKFIFSVTHPAWDLYIYAQEKAGLPSGKIKGLGGYFQRSFSKFVMGDDSKTGSGAQSKFEVEHYHRTTADYFEQLVGVGFTVNRLLEPELTKELLQESPRFARYADYPIGLVFYCSKS